MDIINSRDRLIKNNLGTEVKIGYFSMSSYKDMQKMLRELECNEVMLFINNYYLTKWFYKRYNNSKEHTPINSEIIGEYLNFTKTPTSKIDTINKETIKNELKDQFVFLNKQEEYTESIILDGYKDIGGQFHFKLEEDTLTDHLLLLKRNKSINKVYDEDNTIHIVDMEAGEEVVEDYPLPSMYEAKFPDFIDEYKLYYGKIFTNEVVVEF